MHAELWILSFLVPAWLENSALQCISSLGCWDLYGMDWGMGTGMI